MHEVAMPEALVGAPPGPRPGAIGLRPWQELTRARHCKRAFTAEPVPRRVLETVLETAAHAPSARNLQPWAVEVVTGRALEALSRRLLALYDAGTAPGADYRNQPAEVGGVFAERAAATGAATFAVKGIDREDEEARRRHVRENFRFFGAPVELIFHLPKDWPPGAFLALGCFAQNVMLGLVAAGYGSCPQYSVAGYADAIRHQLGLGDERWIVCGMAVGRPDPRAPVNGLVPERAALGEYCHWHGSDGQSETPG